MRDLLAATLIFFLLAIFWVCIGTLSDSWLSSVTNSVRGITLQTSRKLDDVVAISLLLSFVSGITFAFISSLIFKKVRAK